jgi:hypothetical protein
LGGQPYIKKQSLRPMSSKPPLRRMNYPLDKITINESEKSMLQKSERDIKPVIEETKPPKPTNGFMMFAKVE